ncbi:MAG: FAD-dependent oxidoreductase, partial [Deltaproteobacteria bacterium]|nr:FAD-dependent oxidoreductase [Deltaproteobacteria bacterium]
MIRDVSALAASEFDLVIVGGGIYGATLLWEAARRGLQACLIEQADFGHATSYSSQKIIHGGLRYLQHADLARFRESVRERRLLSRLAPHLLRLMPVLVPAVGHGLQGREALALGLGLNDLLAADRNRGLPPELQVPRGRILAPDEALGLCPTLPREGLSGAALWHEVQVHNTERLLLAYLCGATELGAQLANRLRVTGLLRRGRTGPVGGVRALDEVSGAEIEIRGRAIIAAMGPWTPLLRTFLDGAPVFSGLRFCQSAVLVTRQLHPTHAVGLASRRGYRDSAALVQRGSRLLFVTPWRELSLVGTTQEEWGGTADDLRLGPVDVERFVAEVAEAWPATALCLDDVRSAYVGLIPRARSAAAEPAKHFRIFACRAHGVERLTVVLGVKYTTARDVAVRALALACRQLGRPLPRPVRELWLPGGATGPVTDFLAQAEREAEGLGLSRPTARALAEDHGTRWRQVVAGAAPADLAPIAPGSLTIGAEVV